MLDLDQYEDSIIYTNKEIELIGPSKQSLFNRAFCNNKLNKFEEAENDLKELLKNDKDNLKLIKSLAVCLLNQKKYEEAIGQFSVVINRVDKSEVSEFFKYRSECYHFLKQKEKADEDLKMYEQTKPKN